MSEPCQYVTRKNVARLDQVAALSAEHRQAIQAVSAVWPFRVNRYVVDQLINWDDVPNDPIFQQTFPQRGMLSPADYARMAALVEAGDAVAVSRAARQIQLRENPHPAGQIELNVPVAGGKPIPGLQHKYAETVLFFPRQAQTCHSYCGYCFRWPQFAGIDDLKFASSETQRLVDYVAERPRISDILVTGGDPMVMSARNLRHYIEPLLVPQLDHLQTIRIGSKSLTFWPQRFVTDADADDTLRLFEQVIASGKHLAFMAHVTHPRELSTPMVERAIKRIRSTGAVIRTQAPILRGINDNADTWRELWRRQVNLGMVPYYMFVARDTGPKRFFEVPIARALDVFTRAYSGVSGLARTVRGPSMSATPGKVLVDGTMRIGEQLVFVLKMIQSRRPERVGRTFCAHYDEAATWFSELSPAFEVDQHVFTKAS